MLLSKNFVAILAVLLVTGCATDVAMRQVAGSSAQMVNQFKGATQSFVVNINDLNDADTSRLRRLAGQTQAMQIKSAMAETAWAAIRDDNALTMYRALTKLKGGDVVAGSAALRSFKVEADLPLITADAKQFDSLIQRLNALAASPTFPQLLESWLAFGKQVNDVLERDMKAAGTALLSTKATSQTTSEALVKSQ